MYPSFCFAIDSGSGKFYVKVAGITVGDDAEGIAGAAIVGVAMAGKLICGCGPTAMATGAVNC